MSLRLSHFSIIFITSLNIHHQSKNYKRVKFMCVVLHSKAEYSIKTSFNSQFNSNLHINYRQSFIPVNIKTVKISSNRLRQTQIKRWTSLSNWIIRINPRWLIQAKICRANPYFSSYYRNCHWNYYFIDFCSAGQNL